MPLESTTPKPVPLPSPRVEHEPTTPQLTSVQRRPSYQRTPLSRQQSSRVSPSSDINRYEIAQDHDSFTYDSRYLKDWRIKPEIKVQIPENLRRPIRDLQLAGAAVSTELERIELIRASLLSIEGNDENAQVTGGEKPLVEHMESETLAHKLAAIKASLRRHRLVASYITDLRQDMETQKEEPLDNITGSVAALQKLKLDTSMTDSMQSDGSSSPFSTAPTGGSSDAPSGRSSPVTPMTPLPEVPEVSSIKHDSPQRMPLGPTRSRSGSQIPVIHYVREIEHLKSESLVRLRHKTMHVDKEMRSTEGLSEEVMVWWEDMRRKAIEYEKQGQAFCGEFQS